MGRHTGGDSHNRAVRHLGHFGLVALNLRQTGTQITQRGVDRRDGLCGHLCEIRVLVLLRELVDERAVLFAQRVDLVKQRLVLHGVQLADDGVGVGRTGVTQCERVLVGRVHQCVCLVAYGQLVLVAHFGDVLVCLAAALADLRLDGVVALHDRGDDLVGVHAHLVADVAYLHAKTVYGGQYGIGRGVQRGGQALDVVSVALYGLHDHGGVRVVLHEGDHAALSVAHHSATGAAKTAEASPSHQDEQKQDGEQVVTPAVAVTAVAVSHQRQDVRIHTALLHKRRKHGQYAVGAASGVPVLGEHKSS